MNDVSTVMVYLSVFRRRALHDPQICPLRFTVGKRENKRHSRSGSVVRRRRRRRGEDITQSSKIGALAGPVSNPTELYTIPRGHYFFPRISTPLPRLPLPPI